MFKTQTQSMVLLKLTPTDVFQIQIQKLVKVFKYLLKYFCTLILAIYYKSNTTSYPNTSPIPIIKFISN